jgi:hypothetical protein
MPAPQAISVSCFPSSTTVLRMLSRSIVQTIMTHIVRVAPGGASHAAAGLFVLFQRMLGDPAAHYARRRGHSHLYDRDAPALARFMLWLASGATIDASRADVPDRS